jgi:hypothetical protein
MNKTWVTEAYLKPLLLLIILLLFGNVFPGA